jgi:hypothetical protein
MGTRRGNLKSFNIFPVPNTTLARGSSAMYNGNPVSSRMRLSKFFRPRAGSGQNDPLIADI